MCRVTARYIYGSCSPNISIVFMKERLQKTGKAIQQPSVEQGAALRLCEQKDGFSFHHEISTDGVAVSLLYSKEVANMGEGGPQSRTGIIHSETPRGLREGKERILQKSRSGSGQAQLVHYSVRKGRETKIYHSPEKLRERVTQIQTCSCC